MIFWHGVDHAPTNKRKACLFPIFFRDNDRYNVRKNATAAISWLKNNKKKASLSVVCTCSSNTRLNFQIETRKIERRGIATRTTFLVVLVSCMEMAWCQHLSMGGELANWAIKQTSVFSLGLQLCLHQISPFIENDDFIAKLVLRNVCFQSCRYLVEIEPNYKHAWFVRASASKFEALIHSGSRDTTTLGYFIRF